MDDRERLSNGLMIFMKKWSVLIITSIKEPALLRKKLLAHVDKNWLKTVWKKRCCLFLEEN